MIAKGRWPPVGAAARRFRSRWVYVMTTTAGAVLTAGIVVQHPIALLVMLVVVVITGGRTLRGAVAARGRLRMDRSCRSRYLDRNLDRRHQCSCLVRSHCLPHGSGRDPTHLSPFCGTAVRPATCPRSSPGPPCSRARSARPIPGTTPHWCGKQGSGLDLGGASAAALAALTLRNPSGWPSWPGTGRVRRPGGCELLLVAGSGVLLRGKRLLLQGCRALSIPQFQVERIIEAGGDTILTLGVPICVGLLPVASGRRALLLVGVLVLTSVGTGSYLHAHAHNSGAYRGHRGLPRPSAGSEAHSESCLAHGCESLSWACF